MTLEKTPLPENENESEQTKNSLDDCAEAAQEESFEVLVRPISYYLLIGVIVVLLAAGASGMYFLYPFKQKIQGKWATDGQEMVLTSDHQGWLLEIPNYQGVTGFNLRYEGTWQTSITNQYDGQGVKVSVSVDKKAFPEKELKELEKVTDQYKIEKNTSKKLRLTYTKNGIKKLYGKTSIDHYFHFSLEAVPFATKKTTLYLNSPFFSTDRVPFQRIIVK